MWFESWTVLLRVLLVGTAAYATVVLVLRASGKRTLAKLNAFDLVVTVALGSVLATIVLNRSVTWSAGAVGLVLLALLQTVVAWVTSRRPWLRAAVTARPRLVLRDGRPIEPALRRERLSVDEVRQAVRASGAGDLSSVAAVVLESDGSLSVVSADRVGGGSELTGVAGWGG
jgi:uncharacterized membrane protein YcaP (DUF421 family)